MNKFIRTISMPVVFSMLLVGSIVKAEGSIHWDEDALRVSVYKSVIGALRRNARSSALRDSGYRRVDEACVGLCQTRIELLKKILKNEIFLPVDVDSYLRSGFIAADSYEAERLGRLASTLYNQADWKPKIEKLIEIYESVKWGYENSDLYHLIHMSWEY